MGEEQSLFSQIIVPSVRCLNEMEVDMAKNVFKSYENRLDREKYLESDVDPELLLFVPFNGIVKLKSISIRGAADDRAPLKFKVFINREDLDFDLARTVPALQEWDCPENPTGNDGGIVEYFTKITKFSQVRSLTLYFPDSYGADTTRIDYIGFKGEWKKSHEGPLTMVYESMPNPAEHPKAKDELAGARFV
jgi:hypothetical protein